MLQLAPLQGHVDQPLQRPLGRQHPLASPPQRERALTAGRLADPAAQTALRVHAAVHARLALHVGRQRVGRDRLYGAGPGAAAAARAALRIDLGGEGAGLHRALEAQAVDGAQLAATAGTAAAEVGQAVLDVVTNEDQ